MKISRIDLIGQNGNDGLAYYPPCFGEFTARMIEVDSVCKNCGWADDCYKSTAYIDKLNDIIHKRRHRDEDD